MMFAINANESLDFHFFLYQVRSLPDKLTKLGTEQKDDLDPGTADLTFLICRTKSLFSFEVISDLNEETLKPLF